VSLGGSGPLRDGAVFIREGWLAKVGMGGREEGASKKLNGKGGRQERGRGGELT
jgi:hypothetical protein